uniref:protein-serine/threonine phosphatase n=1 Tax=Onchocerca flexuosa TaxID=387005 RepID=A0A183H4F7_9BILA
LFAGDYLDSFNPKRIDALLLLLCLKLRFPHHIALFRGHFETYEMCKAIGFDRISEDQRLIQKFLCVHAGISPFMSNNTFLNHFVKPVEIKRMNARERCFLTDILYGIPDKNLNKHKLFAPSNIYPIGNRFSLRGLVQVLEKFNCSRLLRGCGCRESSGVNFDLRVRKCISIVSGCSIKHRHYARALIQIFENGEYRMLSVSANDAWNLLNQYTLTISIQIFIARFIRSLRHIPNQYGFPEECKACKWIAQGKRPENVTISHTLLKTFVEGTN